ncbi:hypothetical protein INR49_014302 [Caranx melampygus]|nr:hypothetical protein INR49_014302 [Caranx melampygus]
MKAVLTTTTTTTRRIICSCTVKPKDTEDTPFNCVSKVDDDGHIIREWCDPGGGAGTEMGYNRQRSPQLLLPGAERNSANPANNLAADADAALLAPVWRSGFTRLGGNGRRVFEQGLPGIEGAAHTSLERTELRLGLWRHRVAAQRNGLVLETNMYVTRIVLFGWCN